MKIKYGMILAAGLGKRMQPITLKTPKPLIQIGDKNLLDRAIDLLVNHSVDEIVINVGDMLSRYTNNKLKSTIHKVINPPKELWKKSRYSIPFFLHPVGTMKLNVLDSCIDDENLKKYDDITAHDFLIQRLKDIGVL